MTNETDMPRPRRLLVADIGATNCRFALFTANPDGEALPLLALEREIWLKGAEHASFADALAALGDLLRQEQALPSGPYTPGAPGAPGAQSSVNRQSAGPDKNTAALYSAAAPDIAVLAPAGPIVDGKNGQTCRISNLPWLISAREVKKAFSAEKVVLINDFAAQGYACLLPENIHCRPVLPGLAVAGAPRAVVGAGTGFGKALLLGENAGTGKERRAALLGRLSRARVLPSEGGHEEFPFVGEEEFAFAAFAARREGTPRLILDAIITGKGLAHIFAHHTGVDAHPHEATARAADYPEVMERFARFYGRACRNFVLDTLALGGLYITGGMAQRLPVLEHPAFAEEFVTSASHGDLLAKTPVWHVTSPQAGLWGAALYGLLALHREREERV